MVVRKALVVVMNCLEVDMPERLEENACVEVWDPGMPLFEGVPDAAIELLPPAVVPEEVWVGKKVEPPPVHRYTIVLCRGSIVMV